MSGNSLLDNLSRKTQQKSNGLNKSDKFSRLNELNRFVAGASLAFILSTLPQTLVAKSESESNSQTLRMGIGGEPSSLDPQLATGAPARQVFKGLFEGLVVESTSGEYIKPGIAKSWSVSPDKLTYTFHLRNDAKWSNGDKITADDFLASYKRVLSPKFPAQQKQMFYMIENAERFVSGKETNFANVGIHKKDDLTLELKLERPTPYFLNLIANQYVWDVVPEKVFEKNKNAAAMSDGSWARPENIVTDGPFELSELKHDQRITLEKSKNYWDKDSVKLDKVELYPISDSGAEELLYRTGKLDITSTLPLSKIDKYRRENLAALHMSPYAGIFFLRLNTTTPQLSDKRVREALYLAIDRDALVQKVMNGGQSPAYTLTYPSFAGYNLTSSGKLDVEKARKLLADAGYENGVGFPPTELVYNTNPNVAAISEAIQAMWLQNLGVHINLRNEELAVFQTDVKNKNYQIARGGWTADYDDQLSFLEIFRSDNPNNMTGWSNKEYDSLLTQARKTTDSADRNLIYSKMERILIDEVPVLPIDYMTQVRLINPRVKNYNSNMFDSHPLKEIYNQPDVVPTNVSKISSK